MLKQWQLAAALLVVGAVGIANAENAMVANVSERIKPDAQAIRSVLVPVVNTTLERICGNDCPGFSIIPNVKGVPSTEAGTEDLGFEEIKKTGPEIPKEVQSVSIEVLTSNKMQKEFQETVRATVAAEAKNFTDLPVSVKAKTVTLPPTPVANDAGVTPKDWVEFAKRSLWPLTALLLATLALFGFAYYFHARRKDALALNQMTADESVPQNEAVTMAETINAEKAAALEIFAGRFEDLKFFLEDCSQRSDLSSLRKVVRIFPGDTLSTKLSLTAGVPAAITKAMAETTETAGESETQRFEWLKQELDKAHWRRLSETADPMAKISDLPESQLSSLFSQVVSNDGKALVLSLTSPEKWPRLLSTLVASDKVSVGTSLSKIQQTGETPNTSTRQEVLDALARTVKASHLENLLDEYVLYLSKDETMALSNQLSSKSMMGQKRSVDDMILALNDKELLELVLRLEIDQIRTLLEHLPTEPQQKILSSLPKKLKERVGFFATGTPRDGETTQDPQWLQTRSRIFKLYKEINPRSVH
jgi:hypothetical protein